MKPKTSKEWEYFYSSKTKKLLRDEGYTYRDGHSYNAYIQKSKDLFGFIDIVALKEGVTGVVGVQVTSYGKLKEHLVKAKKLPAFWLWLDCGNQVIFHGWRKEKVGNRELWQPNTITFGPDYLLE